MNRDTAVGLGVGILAGAAIGLVAGIIFAPQSGKETRQQIKERASDMVEKAREGTAEFAHRMEQKIAPSKNGG